MKLIINLQFVILNLFLYEVISSIMNSAKLKKIKKSFHKNNLDDIVIDKSLVFIKAYNKIPLYGESSSDYLESNGFFIDSNIIVAHKKSVYKTSEIEIYLSDGSTYKAGVFFEDAFLPFSLIKINDEKFNANENNSKLRLIDSNNILSLNEELIIVDVNENNMIKREGKLINLNSSLSKRYGNLFKINLSENDQQNPPHLGAPILNKKLEG